MLLKSENNQNNYKEESDVAGITEDVGKIGGAGATGSQNQLPSLLDMTLAVIAQDPALSRTLIQNDGLENSHITEVLIKSLCSPY